MTTPTDKMREAFEAWAAANGYGGIDDMLAPLDRSLRALMWSAWQAALSTLPAPAPAAQAVEALRAEAILDIGAEFDSDAFADERPELAGADLAHAAFVAGVNAALSALCTRAAQPAAQQAPDEITELRAQKDGAYLERNKCVALIARMAQSLGLPVAVTRTAIEGWSDDWHGCIYIGLPTGQVSWHFHDSQAHLFDGLPQRAETWDGHDTPEKYRRVEAAFRGAQQAPAVPQWQPIETAPKDGATVIVGRDMGEFGFVRGTGRFVGVPGSFLAGWVSRGFTDPPGDLGLGHPTHWMPLPAAPQAPAAPEGES